MSERKSNNYSRNKIIALLVIFSFLLNPMAVVDGLAYHTPNPEVDLFDSQDWANGIEQNSQFIRDGASYNESFDLGTVLADADNTVHKVWDPWLTKAAIHAIATTDDGDMMALAGGYLYDNAIHIYSWNYDKDRYDLVWELGSEVFQSDVLTIEFADIDYNNLTEIIAGTQDGFLYVFEQRHLYDPITNMENQFDLVWQSPRLGRIFDLTVGDPDGDFRQDIIVGTAETLRFYEYDDHGNYPFTQDHWMTLREVFTYQMEDHISAIGIADPDYDGLPDVAVGLRSGKVILMENDGQTIFINGQPFPILQDNAYHDVWSTNTIRRRISDISSGDIDDDGHTELLLAVQGQGAYILDNINGKIGTFRIERPFTTWEANPIEIYPLDYYTDAMVNSSSLFNGTLLTPPSAANVYHYNGSYYAEPLNYTLGSFEDVYPYSSHSVMLKDGLTTTFLGTNKPAWADYDFGRDEEASSNGIIGLNDLRFWTDGSAVTTEDIHLSLSNDLVNWEEINSSLIEQTSTDVLEVDVDPALQRMGVDSYQYLRFNVSGSFVKLDVIETLFINNPIYDALSVEVGQLYLKDSLVPNTVGYIATIDGAVLAVDWNATRQVYEVIWDSWVEERFKLKSNVFDLELVKQKSRFPAWVSYDPQTWSLDTSTLSTDMISYTAENFFNYKNENDLEFILSSTNGFLRAYTTSGSNGQPVYSPALTDMLFNHAELNMPTVNDYIASSSANYFSASLIPVETLFYNDYAVTNPNVDAVIDPLNNGYWLMLGAWDGNVALDGVWTQTSPPGVNDVAIFYLTNKDKGSAECANTDAEFDICTLVTPLVNGTLLYKTLTNLEISGVMPGVFRESNWLPKVAAGDMIGSEFSDLILTNGKVHLLETSLSQDPTVFEPANWTNPIPSEVLQSVELNAPKLKVKPLSSVSLIEAISKQYSDLSFFYRGDYFFDINNDSKGRKWTNAQVVNFDGDDDFDLILGFARYNSTYFTDVDKVTYGMTYWENQGSREDPVWVERKKAVTNNDWQSNLRVANFTEPVMVWNDYDFGENRFFDPYFGYSPLYKTAQPTNLFMLQTGNQSSIFNGKIKPFSAVYDHPTSFLAATYPEVKRVDINLLYRSSPSYGAINYGFHIFETWDNEMELRDWTLSMSTADLDEDGKNEVIIGDFNNNIYVFEHLTNNTYKRAYKSFDINRTRLTDQSPYANDQFGGISGTFYQTIFEHVTQLIAGSDLNHNGRQEFIATTDTMIFVFEAVFTATGQIRPDSYELIATIDLLNLPQLINLPQDQIQVTALATSDDFTYDGRGELLVAVNSALLVFEIEEDTTMHHQVTDYEHSPHWVYEEVFFGQTAEYLGSYDVPGNYRLNPNYKINAILVEDLDRDGRYDVVIAGVDKRSARPIWDGFMVILEHDGSVFNLISDDFPELRYAPVNDLAILDADLDDHTELVVAHERGLTIYEFDAIDHYTLQEIISSDPSYPLPTRYYKTMASTDFLSHEKDTLRGLDGALYRVYVLKNATNYYNNLVFEKSTDDGATWQYHSSIQYPHTNEYELYFDQPSLAMGDDSSLWVTYIMHRRVQFFSGSILLTSIMIAKYSNGWSTPQAVSIPTTLNFLTVDISRVSPHLFQIADGSTSEMGLVYNDPLAGALVFMKTNTAGAELSAVFNPYFNNFDPGNFTVHSLDVVRFDRSQSFYNRYDYGFVFSGYKNSEKQALDYDIYYFPFHLVDSSAAQYNFSIPTRTFRSAMPAYYPSIIQEQETGNLLVTFEANTLRPYGGLFAVWSNTEGNFWNGPYDMSHPLGWDNELLFIAFPSRSGETYTVGTTIGGYFLDRFEPRRPVVAEGVNSGFVMSYSADYHMRPRSAQGLCNAKSSSGSFTTGALSHVDPRQCGISGQILVSAVVDSSSFTWYDVGAVQDIAVGDSDQDNRVEILAASGKYATIFEFLSNSKTEQVYNQRWKSGEYARALTSVAISDTNGNGFPELLVESDRGVVHAYEVTSITRPPASAMLRPINEGMIQSDNAGANNMVMDIKTEDLNGDGIEDILYKTSTGQVFAINGADMTNMYQFKDYSTSVATQSYGKNDIKILRDGLGAASALVVAHKENITLLNPANGAVIRTWLTNNNPSGGSDISTLSLMDSGGTTPDILIGFVNGTAVGYDEFGSVLWSYKPTSLPAYGQAVADLIVGNYTGSGSPEVLVTHIREWVSVIDAASGSELWITSHGFGNGYFTLSETYFTTSAAVADFDQDGLDDIVMGANTTFALSGLDGHQLWNRTTYRLAFNLTDNYYISPRTQVRDVNNDGVPDIIQATLYSGNSDMETAIAIDGRDGTSIWEYDPIELNSHSYLTLGLTSFNLNLSQNYSLIAGARAEASSPSKSVGFILNEQTGLAIAGLPVDSYITEITVSNLGFGYPVVIIGDLYGNLYMFSLWEGIPEPSFTPVPEAVEEPFIMLESDFTLRTEFFMADVAVNNVAGTDGIDDIIIVDDDYIGVADTKKLETDPLFNEPFWEWQPADFKSTFGQYPGKYIGGAKLGDIDGNGNMDIVVPYSRMLVVFDLSSGASIFQWEYPNGNEKNQAFDFEIVDWTSSNGFGQEIVYSRNYYITITITIPFSKPIVIVFPYTEFGVLGLVNGGIDQMYLSHSFLVESPKKAIGDFDKDGLLEMVTHSTAITNPLYSNVTMFDNDFTIQGNLNLVLKGLPPVSNLIAGDFDGSHVGDEFIFFFDYSLINLPDFAFLLQKIPTMMMQFQYDATSGFLKSTISNIFGIAPFGGYSKNVFTTDVDGNPLDIEFDGETDMIVQNRRGDLFSINMETGNFIMPVTGTYDSLAVPYAQNNVMFGHFCGSPTKLDMVSVSAGNAVTCYADDPLFYFTQQANWTARLDLGVITNMGAADLDTGTAKDDLMIVTFYVNATNHRFMLFWIINEDSFAPPLVEYGTESVITPGLELNAPVIGIIVTGTIGLLSSPFLVMSYRRRYGKKLKLHK